MKTRFSRVLFVLLAASAALGCGSPPVPTKAAVAIPSGPRWEDAFDTSADILCVLHPKALLRDPLYGPLLSRISLLASSRSAAVAATRSLDAIESSDEVLVALRTRAENDIADDSSAGGGVMLVLRGVRADIDAANVVDSDGRPLWIPATTNNAKAAFTEYTHQESRALRGGGGGAPASTTASLFVLPGRTWVVATGPSRDRAREVFVRPQGRPAFKYDESALVSIRVDGQSLLESVEKLRSSGQLSAIGKDLRTVAFVLRPNPLEGRGDKRGQAAVEVSYSDEESAAVAEVTMRRVVAVVQRNRVAQFWWMTTAQITRDDPRIISIRVTLPESLLSDLAKARSAPVDDRGWPAPDANGE